MALHLFNVPARPQKYALSVSLRHDQIGNGGTAGERTHASGKLVSHRKAQRKLTANEHSEWRRVLAIQSIAHAPWLDDELRLCAHFLCSFSCETHVLASALTSTVADM